MNNIWKCGLFVHVPDCFVSGLYNYELLGSKSAHFLTNDILKQLLSLFIETCVCLCVSAQFVYIYYTVFFCFSLLDFIAVSVGYLAVALSPFAICEKSWKRVCVWGTKTTGRVNALTQNHKSPFSLFLSPSLNSFGRFLHAFLLTVWNCAEL